MATSQWSCEVLSLEVQILINITGQCLALPLVDGQELLLTDCWLWWLLWLLEVKVGCDPPCLAGYACNIATSTCEGKCHFAIEVSLCNIIIDMPLTLRVLWLTLDRSFQSTHSGLFLTICGSCHTSLHHSVLEALKYAVPFLISKNLGDNCPQLWMH